MPRLFGFTPTKKMLEAEMRYVVIQELVNIETIQSVEIPIYTKYSEVTLLKPLPSKQKPSSELKRKVNLNPLSD